MSLLGWLRPRRRCYVGRTREPLPGALAYAMARFAGQRRASERLLVDELLISAFSRVDALIDESNLTPHEAADLLFLRLYFIHEGDFAAMSKKLRAQATRSGMLARYLEAICQNATRSLPQSLMEAREVRLRLFPPAGTAPQPDHPPKDAPP